jgi:hypothetical protein
MAVDSDSSVEVENCMYLYTSIKFLSVFLNVL